MPVQPIVRSDPSGSDSTSTPSIAGPLTAPAPHPDASLSVVLDEAILLAALSNGELAVAIHAAGLPSDTADLSTDQIRALAVTGIALLGWRKPAGSTTSPSWSMSPTAPRLATTPRPTYAPR